MANDRFSPDTAHLRATKLKENKIMKLCMSTHWVCLILSLLFFISHHVEAGQRSRGDVLATVGQFKITKNDLEARIGNLPTEMKATFLNDPEQRGQMLKELVRIEVFSREAALLELDKTERFQRITDEVIKTMLAEEYSRERIISKITITDEDAETYYRNHKDEFMEPEEIVASFFWIKSHKDDPRDRQDRKLRLAEDIRRKLKAGVQAPALVDKVKKEHSALQANAHESIPRGRLIPDVEKTVFNLDIHDVSPVIPIDNGFLVFIIHDKLPAGYNAYDVVRDEIFEKRKTQEKNRLLKNEEKRLFSKYNVEIIGESMGERGQAVQNDEGVQEDGMSETIIAKIVEIGPFQSDPPDNGIIGTMVVGGLGRGSKVGQIVVEILRETGFFRQIKGDYQKVSIDDLKSGQTVEIFPKGPVTRSYPPTVQATKVNLIEF